MIIEHNGKNYDTETWHKTPLLTLLTHELKTATEELELLQSKRDITYANRIFELEFRIKDLKYKLDLLSGKPMI